MAGTERNPQNQQFTGANQAPVFIMFHIEFHIRLDFLIDSQLKK